MENNQTPASWKETLLLIWAPAIALGLLCAIFYLIRSGAIK